MTASELEKWQKRMGLSVEELAALLKVHPVTVSRWRHQARDIPPFLFLALEALEGRLKAKKKPAKK
jgi:plasmid maintenance system antidote protein VapI